jgi:hypothetical protein
MTDNKQHTPPPVLDCARLIEFAILDTGVEFAGHSLLFVDGKELGAVPRLAVCEDVKTSDILLFHCAADWKVLGCSAHPSIADAESRAEHIYQGVCSRWTTANVSRDAAIAYLDEQFGHAKCCICGKRPYEVDSMLQRGAASICSRCAG